MILKLTVKAYSRHIVTYNKQDFQKADNFGIKLVTAKEFLEIVKEIP